MMVSHAISALNIIFTEPYRPFIYKTLLYTVGLLIVAWVILQQFIGNIIFFDDPSYQNIVAAIAAIVTFLGLAFLIPPVSSLVAGFFLDEIAGKVEAQFYPQDPVGKEPKFTSALLIAIKFSLIMAAVNLFALISVWLLGLGLLIFFLANSWLFGREFFEMVAIRHLSKIEAKAAYQDNTGRIFIAGCFICAIASIPLLNLLTAPFAAIFMVHIFKDLQSSQAIKGRKLTLDR